MKLALNINLIYNIYIKLANLNLYKIESHILYGNIFKIIQLKAS